MTFRGKRTCPSKNELKSTIGFSIYPNFVKEGNVVILESTSLVGTTEIVGGLTNEATKKATDIYRTFVNGEVLETNTRTTEMAKLTENSCGDVNIAFANKLSILCDKMDIDVLQLGRGVGGHRKAVDPYFMGTSGRERCEPY